MPEGQLPQSQWPQYQCHKKVRALKIKDVEFNDDGSGTITPCDERFSPIEVGMDWVEKRLFLRDDDLGYYVVYEDGFESWSPTKAFEDGYTRI